MRSAIAYHNVNENMTSSKMDEWIHWILRKQTHTHTRPADAHNMCSVQQQQQKHTQNVPMSSSGESFYARRIAFAIVFTPWGYTSSVLLFNRWIVRRICHYVIQRCLHLARTHFRMVMHYHHERVTPSALGVRSLPICCIRAKRERWILFLVYALGANVLDHYLGALSTMLWRRWQQQRQQKHISDTTGKVYTFTCISVWPDDHEIRGNVTVKGNRRSHTHIAHRRNSHQGRNDFTAMS